jgi:hypothetical protein
VIQLASTNGVGILPQGRVVYRLAKTPVNNPTRNVIFHLTRPTTVTKNNITAGQYIQPVFNYIFPENVNIGSPLPENSFDTFNFLALGGGPYVPGKFGAAPPATPVIVGQLNPWPGLPTPASTVCPPPSTNAPAPVNSPVPTVTPVGTGPVPDTVTIQSATSRVVRGASTVTIAATTNNTGASLSVSCAGVNPISSTPMTNSGGGSWTITIQVKAKPNTCTVTSNKGGSATANVV